MSDSWEDAVLAACLEASRSMGDDVLKLSCFVSRWSEQTRPPGIYWQRTGGKTHTVEVVR